MDIRPDIILEDIELSSETYSASHLSSILKDIQSSSSGASGSSSQNLLIQDAIEDLSNDIVDAVMQEVMLQVTSSGAEFSFSNVEDEEDEEINLDDLF